MFRDHTREILYHGRAKRSATFAQRCALFARDRGDTNPRLRHRVHPHQAHHLPDWSQRRHHRHRQTHRHQWPQQPQRRRQALPMGKPPTKPTDPTPEKCNGAYAAAPDPPAPHESTPAATPTTSPEPPSDASEPAAAKAPPTPTHPTTSTPTSKPDSPHDSAARTLRIVPAPWASHADPWWRSSGSATMRSGYLQRTEGRDRTDRHGWFR